MFVWNIEACLILMVDWFQLGLTGEVFGKHEAAPQL
jgi:hypothetical protein